MTLGLVYSSQQKVILYNLIFKVKIIQIYKRDYFFPFFSELFRRKGLIELAKKIDIITTQITLQLLDLEVLIETLAPYPGLFISSKVPSEIRQEFLDHELLQLLNTYKLGVQSGLNSTLSLTQILELFVYCLQCNMFLFSSPEFKSFHKKFCSRQFSSQDSSAFLNNLVINEVSHNEVIKRLIFKS